MVIMMANLLADLLVIFNAKYDACFNEIVM